MSEKIKVSYCQMVKALDNEEEMEKFKVYMRKQFEKGYTDVSPIYCEHDPKCRPLTNDDKLIILKLHLRKYRDLNDMDKMEECYHCKHKRNVPGDAHISCNNPDPFMKGNEHGIKMGWFIYPLCFDPIWKLFKCNTFEAK